MMIFIYNYFHLCQVRDQVSAQWMFQLDHYLLPMTISTATEYEYTHSEGVLTSLEIDLLMLVCVLATVNSKVGGFIC